MKIEKCPSCGRPMKKIGMTPAQVSVLAIIRTFIAKHGYSPSYDEIGEIRGNVKSVIYHHCQGLIARGHLQVVPGWKRTLTPVNEETQHDQ